MAREINSSDDLKIYNNNRHLKIYAGPGAGKTHLLIENIKQMVQHSTKLQGNFRKILCITYTNVAVEQIQNRLGVFNKNVVVSTIHSFINEYIIKPNQIQLRKIIQDEFGFRISKDKEITSVQEGFSVLSGHKKEDIYTYLERDFPQISSGLYNDLSRNKMADVEVDISSLNTGGINESSSISLKSHESITEEVAKAIKNYTWSQARRLTFDEILYFGYKILMSFDLSVHLVRCEFPYILIDEYQDTNPIQNKIVRILSDKECIVAVIGDIAQSIYSFQGANYKEFQSFNLSSSLPIENFVIRGNRRSTQNIIDFINFLRKDDTDLNEQTCELNFKNEHKVTFLMQKNRNAFSKPIDTILGKDTVFLCRKWSEVLKYVSDIDGEQLKLINNIANTYKYQMKRELENEIDAKREAWIESMLAISELEEAFNRKCIPSAFTIFENYFDIESSYRSFNQKNHQVLNKIFLFWEAMNSCIDDTILLKNLILKTNKLMDDLELPVKTYFRYPVEGDDDYYEGIYKYVDKIRYKTSQKITSEVFSPNSRFMTIHKSKGAEFENVLINIEPANKLDSHECSPINVLCNPVIFGNSTSSEDEKYEEFTRIVYVAASRAKNKLYIHLTGDEEVAGKIALILDERCKKSGREKFYDFMYC